MRTRALLTAALAAAVALPFPAAGDVDRPQARLDGWLQERLATTTEPMRVYVHADTARHARSAAVAAGLQVVESFDKVGVVVADGRAPQVRRVLGAPHVSYVEGDRPAELMLDKSDRVTRNGEARRLAADRGRAMTGQGVSIAVIDTGVDGTHPFFRRPDGTSKVVANLKTVCHNLGYLASDRPVNEDDACWAPVLTNDSDTGSAGGHGTHVAGIAAGVPMTVTSSLVPTLRYDVVGAAPGASLVALSVGASTSVYGGNTGLNWVLNHHRAPCGEPSPACPPIKVTNNSYGPTGGSRFSPEGVTAKLQRALVREGVVSVWAAGNDAGDGSGKDVAGRYQGTNGSGADPTPGIVMAASYNPGTTGSRDGNLSSFSSRGVRGQPDTYPDVSAPGDYVLSSCRSTQALCTGLPYDGPGPADKAAFTYLGGTSMAAPYVAGVAAELLEIDPRLSPGQVEIALEDGAHRFAAGASYEADPYNPSTPTSYDKGHGLVDVVASADRVRAGGISVPAAPAGPEYVPYDAGPTTLTCSTAFVDAKGDATPDVAGQRQSNQPSVDLRAGRWSWDGAALTATFVVDDISASRPVWSNGERFRWDVLPAEGQPFQVTVGRGGLGTTYLARGTSTSTARLSVVDRPGTGSDEVRVSFGQAELDLLTGSNPRLRPGLGLRTQRASTAETVTFADVTADAASPGPCPYLLGAKDRTEVAPPAGKPARR